MFSVTRTVAPPTMLIDRRGRLYFYQPVVNVTPSSYLHLEKKERKKKKNSIVRVTFEKEKEGSSSQCKAFEKTFQIWTVFLISSIPSVPNRRDREREREREKGRETF